METISWIINILSMIGWLINIKYRKYAMIVFTISTILSIIYFSFTWQVPFLVRSIFYLGIDVATLYQIRKELKKK